MKTSPITLHPSTVPSQRFFAPLVIFAILGLCSWGISTSCSPVTSKESAQESTTSETVAEFSAEGSAENPVSDVPAENPAESAAEPKPEVAPEVVAESTESVQDAGQEPVTDASPETPAETIPEPTTSQVSVAYIYNSDFVKGSLSVFSIADRKLLKEWVQIDTAGDLDGDFAIRVHDDKVFLINRGKGDITVLDAANKLNKIATVSVGAGTNPHDVAIVGQKRMFVTQYDKTSVIVYEENKSPVTIDLSSLAETSTKTCNVDADCSKFGAGSMKCDSTKSVCVSDGQPELDSIIAVGNKVYVAVQALDRNDGYKPSKSYIAVIDATTDKLVNKLELHGANPVGFVKEPAGTYLIASTVSTLVADDGGAERFDPATDKLSGSFVITEKELGGNFSFPQGMVIVSATLGYALVSDASFKQNLVQFDPSTGKKLKDVLTGKSLSSIALSPSGELLVGDKGDGQSAPTGLRIYEASTGTEVTTAPIKVGQSLPLPPGIIVVGEIDKAQLP